MRIIDMHCDTIMEGWRHPEKNLVDGNETAITLKLLRENHSLAQCFALYLPREEMETMDSYDILKSMYVTYRKMIDENTDLIRPALCAEDIEKNRDAGLLSSILTVEDGVFVDGRIERLDEAFDMGIRLITLLWNFENSIGFPNSMDHEEHMKGLKPFGIECVEKMNDLGIIVDVSHLSEGGFFDVAKYSSKPFVASHSCARALCNHQRNLTDEQLKALGNAGGMVGINFECSFLNDSCESATYDRILEHLCYMKDKAGIDAIGFGSDFDGIDDNGELVNYGGFTRMLDELTKKFTDDEIDKICSLNALRVMRDVIGR